MDNIGSDEIEPVIVDDVAGDDMLEAATGGAGGNGGDGGAGGNGGHGGAGGHS